MIGRGNIPTYLKKIDEVEINEYTFTLNKELTKGGVYLLVVQDVDNDASYSFILEYEVGDFTTHLSTVNMVSDANSVNQIVQLAVDTGTKDIYCSFCYRDSANYDYEPFRFAVNSILKVYEIGVVENV